MTAATAFTVLIPARMASSRLPINPWPKSPVYQWSRSPGAAQSARPRTVVAADDARIVEACPSAMVWRPSPPAQTTPAAAIAWPKPAHCWACRATCVVNVQGDRALIDPQLINAVRPAGRAPASQHGNGRLPHRQPGRTGQPQRGQGHAGRQRLAHYFSRAPIPFARDQGNAPRGGRAPNTGTPGVAAGQFAPLRHIGIYSYRAGFCASFRPCPRPRPKPLNNWNNCVHSGTATVLPCMSPPPPQDRVWIRHKIWHGCGRCWIERQTARPMQPGRP